MNPLFSKLMSQATRLTQAGRLHEATAAIQAALRRPGQAPDGGEVIEMPGPTRPTEPTTQPPTVAQATAPGLHPPVPPGTAAAMPLPDQPDAAPPRLLAGSHTEAAGSRTYKLFLPDAPAGHALPLVVMLHGCTQDPDDFAAGTRMNEAALRRGFAVLYPAQQQGHNPQRCWNWFKHNHQGRGRGEPAILAGMVRAVVQRYGLDARRVYVAGLSAGGAMAAILGDAYPDLFAAVGVHSGLPTGAAHDVGSALAAMQGAAAPPAAGASAGAARQPTIVFHGDRDTTVHPVNGERLLAMPPGAAPGPVEQLRGRQGRDFTRHIQRDAAGRVVAEHWLVHGAGHAWSGGSAEGSYADPRGPDASAEMLRFFALHTLAPRA